MNVIVICVSYIENKRWHPATCRAGRLEASEWIDYQPPRLIWIKASMKDQMLRERTTTARGGEAQGSTVRQQRRPSPLGIRPRRQREPLCRSECDTNEQIRGKVTDQCSCVYETPLPLNLCLDRLYIPIEGLRTSIFWIKISNTKFGMCEGYRKDVLL